MVLEHSRRRGQNTEALQWQMRTGIHPRRRTAIFCLLKILPVASFLSTMFGKLLQPETIFSLKMHLNRLSSSQCSPDPLAGFKGSTLPHGRREKEGRDGTKGEGSSPHQQFLDPPRSVKVCSVLFFSRPRSEGGPHRRRTFSIYPCPLSF